MVFRLLHLRRCAILLSTALLAAAAAAAAAPHFGGRSTKAEQYEYGDAQDDLVRGRVRVRVRVRVEGQS